MKNFIKKASIIIVLLILGFVIYFAIGFILLMNPDCDDKVISELISPSDEYKAILYIRNCGATTDFSTQIKLEELSGIDWEFKKDKNRVYYAKGYHDNIMLEWLNDRNLKVIFNETTNNEKITTWRDVKIEYVPTYE